MLRNSGLLMRFGLEPEIEQLQELARRWAEADLAPVAEELDRSNSFPRKLWPKLGELGLMGLTIPEEYGGTDLGYLAHAIVVEEIARISPAIALSYTAHSNLCANQIQLNGTPSQKETYLPKLISGEHVGALAMSETGSGSDVVSMTLRAEERDSCFILNGTKMWITNAPHADVMVVYAKTRPEWGHKGITAFIVEKGFDGFNASPKLDKLGMRGSDTSEIVFSDCRIPKENILGELNDGVRVLMSGLDYERIIVAAICTGMIEAALDQVLPYIHDRKQFGQRIGEFQLVQAKIADMYTSLGAARAYVYAAAAAADRKEVTRQDAAACFLFASEAATKAALDAIQLQGGNGYMNDCPSTRLLRDAKLLEIGGGTTEIRRMLIGRELFRKSA